MATVSHEPMRGVEEKRRPSSELLIVREMWASLAIAVIWLSVLFDAIYGPSIVNTSAGGDMSTVPQQLWWHCSPFSPRGSLQSTAIRVSEKSDGGLRNISPASTQPPPRVSGCVRQSFTPPTQSSTGSKQPGAPSTAS